MTDTPHKQLYRMQQHFLDLGLYTKANYCVEIAEYIDKLETLERSIRYCVPEK